MFGHSGKLNGAVALIITAMASMAVAGYPGGAGSEESQTGGSVSRAIVLAQAGNYPGAFLSGPQTSQYSRVGRLSVQLLQNGTTQEVPFDWAFHTNDEFRFKIATNREGWLYILHRSPGGELKVLYPPTDPNTGQIGGNSRVEKNRYYLVPAPTEGSFIFDTDTGTETFFLVIKDRPEPPALNDIIVSNTQSPPQQQGVPGPQDQSQYQTPYPGSATQYPPQGAPGPQDQSQYQMPPSGQATQYPPQGGPGPQDQSQYQTPYPGPATQYPPQGAPGPQDQSQYQMPTSGPAQSPPQPQPAQNQQLRKQWQQLALDTLNYSVIPRGAKKLASLKYRGVSFKPAAQSNDPGTYFAPQPDSELQDAWFVFRLNHVD